MRLSAESLRQLICLSLQMQRSEANVVEIAIDRMYREEIRFGGLSISEAKNAYNIEESKGKEWKWSDFLFDLSEMRFHW